MTEPPVREPARRPVTHLFFEQVRTNRTTCLCTPFRGCKQVVSCAAQVVETCSSTERTNHTK